MWEFYTTNLVNGLVKEKYFHFIEKYYSDILQHPYTYIQASQEKISQYLWGWYVQLLNSGTTWLQFALLSLGVGPWDEVIIPTNTYAADAIVIKNIWAKVVFCDINLDTFCLDVWDVKRKLSSKTKAIIATHLYGYPADIHALLELKKHHQDIAIIEDASHAFWWSIKWQKQGTIWDIGIFSAHISKNFWTLGNGWIFFTKNKEIFEKIDHYMFPDRNHRSVLLSWRTPANIGVFDAIMLLIKIQIIDSVILSNRELFSSYIQKLQWIKGLQLPSIDFEFTSPHIRNFTFLSHEENPFHSYGQKFYGLDLSKTENFGYNTHLPNSEVFFKKSWSLPFYFWMKENHNIENIIKNL